MANQLQGEQSMGVNTLERITKTLNIHNLHFHIFLTTQHNEQCSSDLKASQSDRLLCTVTLIPAVHTKHFSAPLKRMYRTTMFQGKRRSGSKIADTFMTQGYDNTVTER